LEIKRTHDHLYLNEDRRQTPKEYFKFIWKHSESFIQSHQKPVILDVGCATGEFLWYLSQVCKDAELYGMDPVPELIERAEKTQPNCHFFTGNIVNREGAPKKKFDAVFMLGVHSIFDDYKPWIDNLLRLVKPTGRIYVFGMFNPYPIDVLVKARRSLNDGPWEPGWNVFSCATLSDYLRKCNAVVKFIPWKINIDIPQNHEDLLRSWTFKAEDGSRLVVNGTRVLHDFHVMEIIPG
jgi:trans-aconitate methyltransferase